MDQMLSLLDQGFYRKAWKGRIAAVGHKRLAYWLDGMIYRILNFISNKV
jgi:hypothetical protein